MPGFCFIKITDPMIRRAGKTGPEKEDMEKKKKSPKDRFLAYIQKFFNLILKAVIWAGICVAMNIGLLYFAQLLMGFYLKTPMGPEFINENPELMDTIAKLTGMGFEELSITLTVTAFLTCLGILAACKLFFLARYIAPMGTVGRVVACVLPFSVVVAMLIPKSVPVGGWEIAYTLSVFPTLVMFNSCFAIADGLLPEVDELIAPFQKKEDPGKRFNGRR
jgi:hypothetical protein